MKKSNLKLIEWTLRIGVFMTFLGHGIFAIQGNPNWIKYLETVYIPTEIAQSLITYIGCLDIVVAIFVLLKPYKQIVIWAIFWCFLTALIRPISGESIWAFIERGANFMAPLALYYIIKE
ncbi:hypothetical protein [Wocania ichthyoenteri]|uniref:hypothetical protein n=1 Tax=Wocania ichthyoenteri TaxID=1230531 RepID=UPI00053F016C|nr:hypothetical protein [Wocania ichthyoenteri]